MRNSYDFINWLRQDASEVDYTIKCDNALYFIEKVFELSMGDNAHCKKYTDTDILDNLERMIKHDYDKIMTLLLKQYNSIDDFEKDKKELLNEINL